MGKWHRIANKYQIDYLDLYRAYTPLKAECESLRIEAAHHKAEATKTVAFAKRERERGDNLQRELLAKTNECQQRDASMAEYESRLKHQDEAGAFLFQQGQGWQQKCDAAERERDVAVETYNNLVLARRSGPDVNADLVSDLNLRTQERDAWQAKYVVALRRVDDLEHMNQLSASEREQLAHCTLVNEEVKRQDVERDRDDWHYRYDAAMARGDDLEAQVKVLREERDTDRDEMALGMLRAIEGQRGPAEMATVAIRRIIRERDVAVDNYTKAASERDEGWAEVRRMQACDATHPTKRRKIDDERKSYTVKLRIGDKSLIEKCPTCKQPKPESPRCSSFTLHVGYYPDGTVAEWFIRPDREKKTDLVASLADGWATSSSYAIQNGGDVRWLTDKARYARDESAGVPLVWDRESDKYITHPAMHHVSSVLDYAARVIDRLLAGKPATRLTEDEEAEMAKKLAEATP